MLADLHLVSSGDSLFVRQFHYKIVEIKIWQLPVETFNLQIIEVDVKILDFKVYGCDDVARFPVEGSRIENVAFIFAEISFEESLKSF